MSEQVGGISSQWEIRATFANSDQMQDAVNKLTMSGFDRADISLPSPAVIEGAETPEAGTKPAFNDQDARQIRTLGASTAAAAAAMAAAGITIATGGAAAPAVAAAVLAGGAAGGSVFAVQGASDQNVQNERDARAASGDLVLVVRALTEAKQLQAEEILKTSGGTDIEAAR